MPNLFISYDLAQPQRNYPAVEKPIKALGPAIKLLQTVWYVRSNVEMEPARDSVAKTLDSDDKLLVIAAYNACGTRIGKPWDELLMSWIKT